MKGTLLFKKGCPLQKREIIIRIKQKFNKFIFSLVRQLKRWTGKFGKLRIIHEKFTFRTKQAYIFNSFC